MNLSSKYNFIVCFCIFVIAVIVGGLLYTFYEIYRQESWKYKHEQMCSEECFPFHDRLVRVEPWTYQCQCAKTKKEIEVKSTWTME